MTLTYSANEKRLSTAEPLKIMRFLVVTARGDGKIIRKIEAIALCIAAFLFCMQLVSFLGSDGADSARILMTSTYLYIIGALICFTFIVDFQSLLRLKNTYCWSLDSAGAPLKRYIFKIGKTEDLICLVAYSTNVLYATLIMMDIRNLWKADYTSEVLRKHLPTFEMVYLSVLIVWLSVTSLIVLTWPFVLIYYSWAQQFQLLLLNHYIKEISNDFERYTVGGLLNDEHYQKIIWERLKFVIKRHGDLLRFRHDVMNYSKSNVMTLILGICATSLALACCWNVMSSQRLLESLTPFVGFVITLEMLASSAQKYQDKFAGVYDSALEVPWYEWDNKNKMAYLLLVRQSMKMVPYKFFNLPVNRAFQLKLWRTIYAIGNVLGTI